MWFPGEPYGFFEFFFAVFSINENFEEDDKVKISR